MMIGFIGGVSKLIHSLFFLSLLYFFVSSLTLQLLSHFFHNNSNKAIKACKWHVQGLSGGRSEHNPSRQQWWRREEAVIAVKRRVHKKDYCCLVNLLPHSILQKLWKIKSPGLRMSGFCAKKEDVPVLTHPLVFVKIKVNIK